MIKSTASSCIYYHQSLTSLRCKKRSLLPSIVELNRFNAYARLDCGTMCDAPFTMVKTRPE